MSNNLELLLGHSCLLPMLYYLWRYKKIDKIYFFFFLVLLSDCVMELSNILFKKVFLINVRFTFSIYLITNFYFFLQFAYQNKYLSKLLAIVFFGLGIIFAIFNILYIGTLNGYLFYALCYTSMIMLFISIKMLSTQIFETKKKWHQNFWFVYSCAAIVYHAFTLLIFGLYYFSLFKTPNGRSVVYIHHFVNVGYYLLLLWAIFLLPKKQIELPTLKTKHV